MLNKDEALKISKVKERETEGSRLVSQISQLCKLQVNWRRCLQTKVEHSWGTAPKIVLLPPQAQILMGMWTHMYTHVHRKEIKKQHTTQALLSLLLRLHVVTFWREKYPWPFPSFAWLIILWAINWRIWLNFKHFHFQCISSFTVTSD